MSLDELETHIVVLEDHVAKLEGIIHEMLGQIEAGTIAENAALIKAELMGLISQGR